MRLVAIFATDTKGIRVQCAECHAMLPLFGAVADLDGKAFVYYHEACAPSPDQGLHRGGAVMNHDEWAEFSSECLDAVETATCPQCRGEGRLLGYLGAFAWFRCRQCGWEFNRKEGK